jgi:hypothetical protein
VPAVPQKVDDLVLELGDRLPKGIQLLENGDEAWRRRRHGVTS